MKKNNTKNTERLIPWKPGQSGNPRGRPKGAKDSLEARVRRLLNKVAPDQIQESLRKLGVIDKKSTATLEEAIVARLILNAVSGDIKASREILNRAYGMPRQTVEQDLTVYENVERAELRAMLADSEIAKKMRELSQTMHGFTAIPENTKKSADE